MFRSLTLMGLLATLPVAAQAFEAIDPQTGFYIGGGVGNTNLNLSSTAFGDAGSEEETGFKLTGGWQFHPFLAAELSYYNPGDFSERVGADALKVSADIFEASLVGTFPIVGNLQGFGRAGFARWDGRLDATVDGESGSFEDTGTDFNWELGLQYRFSPHFRIRAGFEQTEIDTSIADVLPVTWRVRFTQLTAIYQF
jgi:OmpA-OmpF porin, OOP family